MEGGGGIDGAVGRGAALLMTFAFPDGGGAALGGGAAVQQRAALVVVAAWPLAMLSALAWAAQLLVAQASLSVRPLVVRFSDVPGRCTTATERAS